MLVGARPGRTAPQRFVIILPREMELGVMPQNRVNLVLARLIYLFGVALLLMLAGSWTLQPWLRLDPVSSWRKATLLLFALLCFLLAPTVLKLPAKVALSITSLILSAFMGLGAYSMLQRFTEKGPQVGPRIGIWRFDA